MRKLFIIAMLSLVFVFSGCSLRFGQFTAASTQNVRNLKYSLADKTKQHVVGETCIHTLLVIPVGPSDDRIQRAMDDAIKNGQESGLDGDLLVNVRIENTWWTMLLYSQNCVRVEGDLVKLD